MCKVEIISEDDVETVWVVDVLAQLGGRTRARVALMRDTEIYFGDKKLGNKISQDVEVSDGDIVMINGKQVAQIKFI